MARVVRKRENEKDNGSEMRRNRGVGVRERGTEGGWKERKGKMGGKRRREKEQE